MIDDEGDKLKNLKKEEDDRILIKNQIELDILTYISFYLSKKEYFTSITENDNYKFIYLYNIKTF